MTAFNVIFKPRVHRPKQREPEIAFVLKVGMHVWIRVCPPPGYEKLYSCEMKPE